MSYLTDVKIKKIHEKDNFSDFNNFNNELILFRTGQSIDILIDNIDLDNWSKVSK